MRVLFRSGLPFQRRPAPGIGRSPRAAEPRHQDIEEGDEEGEAKHERPQRDPGIDVLEIWQVEDRKSVGEGKSVSVRGDLGGRRIIKKKRTREYRRLERVGENIYTIT